MTITIGVLLSFASLNVDAHDHMSHVMKPAEPLPGTSIYNLTSSWTDQNGSRVNLESLRGAPTVVTMGYTSCKDICPMIVANMMAIEDRAKASSMLGVHYVFFSLDTAVDTPERLTAYAKDRGLDFGDWVLFNGDDKAVRELAAALGVRYRRDASGGFDHSAIITILDAEGRIVTQQPDVTANTEDMVKKLSVLFAAPSH
ncbi:MAG TPA: SCO family protein [Bradyrhizobium sp.]|nr:SCO family protein [Bradyrhizobium sp.]